MNLKLRKSRLIVLLLTAFVVATLAGVSFATPPSGVVGTIMARAGFKDPVAITLKVQGGHGHKNIQVRNAAETVMQKIVIAPGGTTGWHSHPGPAVALVQSGELTLYAADDRTCTGNAYPAGRAFVDPGQGHVHNARNLGAVPVEVWVTYFDVPPGETVRIDKPAPGTCSF